MRLDESATPGWLWRAVGCGGAAVLVLYLFSLLLAAMLGPVRDIGQAVACQANVSRLVRGMRMYADDYDDCFPQAARWMDRTVVYLDDVRRLHCPTAAPPGDSKHYGYAMNSRMSGKARRDLDNPDTVPLIYDSSNLTLSASDPFTSLPVPGRHRGRARRGEPYGRGNVIGYAGGRYQFRMDAGTSGKTGGPP